MFLHMNPLWSIAIFLGGIIMFLLFVGLLMFLARLLFRGSRGVNLRPSWRYRDEAFEILDSRYARGEITREQYLEIKRTLEER